MYSVQLAPEITRVCTAWIPTTQIFWTPMPGWGSEHGLERGRTSEIQSLCGNEDRSRVIRQLIDIASVHGLGWESMYQVLGTRVQCTLFSPGLLGPPTTSRYTACPVVQDALLCQGDCPGVDLPEVTRSS